jgi:hypothetical protein
MKIGNTNRTIFCFGMNCIKENNCFNSLKNTKRLKKYKNNLAFEPSTYCIENNYCNYKKID